MIEFHSVTYQYPDGPVALHNVSISIEAGSLVAIMGRNGAGKTTFVKCINGLIKPTRGEVFVGGVSTRKKSVAEMSKTVGLVFQNSDNQLFSVSVNDELDFSLKNAGIPYEEREKIIKKTLERLNLIQFKEKSPFLLSGGERKRVAFASLMCMEQDVFIADEPTQGQDEIQRKNIEQILKQLHDEGKTILIVTHDLDFILRMATRLIIFDQGRILIDSDVATAFKNPEILKLEGITPTQELKLKWLCSTLFRDRNDLILAEQEHLVNIIVEQLKVKKARVN